MKFTLSWLKKYLDTSASAEEIAQKLNSIGHEVEEFVDKGKIYEPFVIGQIKSTIPHPNAEKLQICQVDDGKQVLQIVCGAANAKSALKVVIAPVGTIIPANGMVIKQSKIRDVESCGMLCSAEELSIGEDSEGILELPEGALIGQSYAEYANLNDTYFELSITPNRGDVTSVFGVARDMAAAGVGTLIEPDITTFKGEVESKINISIEVKDKCAHFFGRYVESVKNCDTPDVVRNHLRSIGTNPKSALVDFSNFAMFSLGRPCHIYDADKIEGNIRVTTSKGGEKFLALNEEEYILPEGLLIVADDKKVIAIAGVIGGDLTKVTKETKNIFIEVANFHPEEVAKAGRALNIITNSRYRFERRVDGSNTEMFINYLTKLVIKSCSGKPSKLTVTKGNEFKYLTSFEFDNSYIKKLSGLEVDINTTKKILKNLGIKYDGKTVSIPPHRQGDIIGQADIVEEVLRINGFDKIPSQELGNGGLKWKEKVFSDKARSLLCDRGLSELVTWSFMSEEMSKIFGFKDSINLKNPISQDLTTMRQSILPNLIEAAQKNASISIDNLSLFEVSNIYSTKLKLRQSQCIAAIRCGTYNPYSAHKDSRIYDFYDIKADIFSLIREYGLEPSKLVITRDTPKYYHPGKSMALFLGKSLVGYAGQISPKILREYDLLENVLGFELFVDNLPQLRKKYAKPVYHQNNLQPLMRDFAFIIDENIEAQDLIKTIKSADINLIEDVNIFDIYTGENIEHGKKSVAINVKIQPQDKTLSDNEISILSEKIITEASIKLSANLR